MLQVLPFGGCMLASALAEPQQRKEAITTYYAMRHSWPVCYTVQEALRTVEFYRGKRSIPQSLRPLCNLPNDFDAKSELAKQFENFEVVLFEPNSYSFLLFEDVPITRSLVDTLIVTPLKAAGGNIADAAATWFNNGLLAGEEEIQVEAAQSLLPELEGRVENPNLISKVLVHARSVTPSFEEFVSAATNLKNTLDKPFGIVTFTFQYLPNGRPITWPPDFAQTTFELAKRLGVPCFHPADVVRKHGARVALQDNLRFYRKEFEPIIGSELLRFAQSLLETRKSPMLDKYEEQSATPEEMPSNFVKSYSMDNLQTDCLLANVDFASPLAGWSIARASLSDTSIPSSLPGVRARKLVEQATDAINTHTLYGYVKNTTLGKRFRLAFMARQEERDQVRCWLGTGRPGNGSDRVDVAIDLTTGIPIGAYGLGQGWKILDTGTEGIGDKWRLCWVIGEVDRVIPELLVAIMTVKGGGAQYPGDGRSGLWIGGLRLDVVNDVDPVETVWNGDDAAPRKPARSDDNRRDLADLVSDEILSFLRDEQREAGDIYQWYKHRYIENGIGLSRIDRAIAAFVIRRFGATRTTLEVGAGVAQCSQFLALAGVRTAGLEASHSHFEMMKRLTARLAERFDPDLSRRFTAIRGSYPDEASPFINEKTILIVPSLGSTLTAEQEIGVFDVLKRADGVILGTRMFFRVRDTEVERDSLVKQIQERGFGEAEEILSWSDGSFGFVPDRIIFLPKVS